LIDWKLRVLGLLGAERYRSRSLRWKNKSKHCFDWFVVREKRCSGWKNKLKKMDYKRSEQPTCWARNSKWHEYGITVARSLSFPIGQVGHMNILMRIPRANSGMHSSIHGILHAINMSLLQLANLCCFSTKIFCICSVPSGDICSENGLPPAC